MNLLEETKSLLRRYRIVPNRLRGQNFTVDPSVFEHVINHASVNRNDVVLDVGAGFGFLTKILSDMCKLVFAVESDRILAETLQSKFRDSTNVKVIEGNILKVAVPTFSKVVSVPPYGISSGLLLWLFQQSFECAVSVFQCEFANKLVADVGSDDYGWLTVLTTYHFEAELMEAVPASAFLPQPEVNSIIVLLKPWEFHPFKVQNESVFKSVVRFLFTQRNRKLRKVLFSYAKRDCSVNVQSINALLERVRIADRRVRDLTPEEFGMLADACSE